MGKRIFIAINLDQITREKLINDLVSIKGVLDDRAIKWVKPANIHLTLVFLGDVEETKIPLIKKGISGILKDFQVILLRLKNIGFFPHPQKPRIIWIGAYDQTGQIDKIHKQIIKALDSLNLHYDMKALQPHLTIGRIKFKPKKDLIKAMRTLPRKIYGELNINHIDIMSSQLNSDGPRYKIEGRINLG